MTSHFYDRVYHEVQKVPYGKVATYGQIAALCGHQRGARMVGWALRHSDPDGHIPWHRIVNREGRISIIHKDVSQRMQADLLVSEGIDVTYRGGHYWIDMQTYQWRG